MALVLAEWLPWRIIYIGLGCVLSVGVVCTLIGPEPERGGRAAHVPEGGRRTVRRLLPPAALAGRGRLSCSCYSFGDTIAIEDVAPVFYIRQVGFRLVDIGTINKITVVDRHRSSGR